MRVHIELQNLRRNVASLASSVVPLGLGEGLGRIFNLAVVVVMSRRFGVSTIGAFALGQTVSQYLIPGIDMGLRHIGARLIANHPEQCRYITGAIQGKRLITAAFVIPMAFLYGKYGPIPLDARDMVCLYSLSLAPYAVSLDWLAWGLKRFVVLGAWRAFASFCYFIVAILGFTLFHAGPLYAALANATGYFAGSLCLWVLLRPHLTPVPTTVNKVDISSEVNWPKTIWMGSALIFNQAFNSIDALVLGALSNTTQVGLYNAAYRVLLLLLSIYYLATQAIYPRISTIPPAERSIRTISRYLILVAVVGAVVVAAVEPAAHVVIRTIYGQKFDPAVPLLRVLILALPLDFMTSLLGVTLVAWGKSKTMLITTVSATTVNVALNVYLIPRQAAFGAAWATIASYLVLLIVSIGALTSPEIRTFCLGFLKRNSSVEEVEI